jgi:hypothetical protein
MRKLEKWKRTHMKHWPKWDLLAIPSICDKILMGRSSDRGWGGQKGYFFLPFLGKNISWVRQPWKMVMTDIVPHGQRLKEGDVLIHIDWVSNTGARHSSR